MSTTRKVTRHQSVSIRKRPHLEKDGEISQGRPSKVSRPSLAPLGKEEIISHPSHSNPLVGEVLVLGTGDMGQLGLGPNTLERRRPALLKLPSTSNENGTSSVEAVQVCAGGMHSVIVTRQGSVFTWGCGDEGALGRDTKEEDSEMLPHPVARLVSLGVKIVQVSAGDSHTAALTETGRLFLWGTFRDHHGVLGLLPNSQSKIEHDPVEVMNSHVVIKISSGTDHVVALTRDGHLYTMGCGEQGQLGRVPQHQTERGGRHGLSTLLQPSICRLRGGITFSDAWAGSASTVALTTDRQLYACGLNNYGQVGLPGGDSTSMTCKFMLERAHLPSEVGTIKMFALGQHHSLILNDKGHVFSIGRVDYGRLGIATKDDMPQNQSAYLSWTRLAGELSEREVSWIACGSSCSFAIEKDTGRVWSWGMASNLQLGTGDDDDDIYIPQPMEGKLLQDKRAIMVSAGGQHTMLLASSQDSKESNSDGI